MLEVEDHFVLLQMQILLNTTVTCQIIAESMSRCDLEGTAADHKWILAVLEVLFEHYTVADNIPLAMNHCQLRSYFLQHLTVASNIQHC